MLFDHISTIVNINDTDANAVPTQGDGHLCMGV